MSEMSEKSCVKHGSILMWKHGKDYWCIQCDHDQLALKDERIRQLEIKVSEMRKGLEYYANEYNWTKIVKVPGTALEATIIALDRGDNARQFLSTPPTKLEADLKKTVEDLEYAKEHSIDITLVTRDKIDEALSRLSRWLPKEG